MCTYSQLKKNTKHFVQPSNPLGGQGIKIVRV